MTKDEEYTTVISGTHTREKSRKYVPEIYQGYYSRIFGEVGEEPGPQQPMNEVDAREEPLEDAVIPAITALFPGENGGIDNRIFFQQDAAPPHFAVHVREYLNHVIRNRWIGRRGSIERPARSPGLTPFDFFLWGSC
ncbi:hypothetical protein NQ318_016279 [Aromia moschata]|uniref:Transposase n=1 Tax=Aromia moschata TaxID=1265417 RepID=A0AAV8XXT9_9CUCU|nr:hypothetical protein NQ318_016279 [Aromia moschata]